MFERRGFVFALGALALAPAGAAQAHHGFTGRYDGAKPIWIEGRVESLVVSPPHPVLRVKVARTARVPTDLKMSAVFTGPLALREDFAGQSVEIEFPPIQMYIDLGSSVRAGDTVAVVALRNCRAPHQLRSQWIRTASGTVFERPGSYPAQANGCQE